jgi:hypothetical protein
MWTGGWCVIAEPQVRSTAVMPTPAFRLANFAARFRDACNPRTDMLWHLLTSQEVIGETVGVHHPVDGAAATSAISPRAATANAVVGRLVAYGAE